MIAGVLYLGVPYEALAGFPIDPSRSYLSELAAEDQPLRWMFRGLDGAAGILAVIGAKSFLMRGSAVRLRFAAGGVAVFGVGTLADVVLPMACASSVSASCAAADAAGRLGLIHQAHSVASVVALGGAVFAAVGIASAMRGSMVAPMARVTIWVGAGMLVAATVAVSVLAIGGIDDGVLPAGGGYVQRLQTILVSVLLIVFGPLGAAVTRGRAGHLAGGAASGSRTPAAGERR